MKTHLGRTGRKRKKAQKTLFTAAIVAAATASLIVAVSAVFDAAPIMASEEVIKAAGNVTVEMKTTETLAFSDENDNRMIASAEELLYSERLAEEHLQAIETTAQNLEAEATYSIHEEIPLSTEEQAHLQEKCEEYGVPYHIALGVIQTESSFRADARNGTCSGYMQINSINLEWLKENIGVTDLTDPLQNISSGVFMLADLYDDYQDWHKALIAYNYGPAGAKKNVFSKGYTTTTYSRKVMNYAEQWLEILG